MGQYLKLFRTEADYEAASDKPQLAHIIEDVNIIEAETRLVAIHNVTTTSSPTYLIRSQNMSGFTSMEIDGVMLPEVVTEYTFSTTGKHTVKLGLRDQTTIGGSQGYMSSCLTLTSVIIPPGVEHITTSMFHGCYNLKDVVFPDGLKEVGQYSFYGCSGLTEVDLPDSVTLLNSSCFSNCTSLQSFTIHATTPPSLGNGLGNTNNCTIYVPANSVSRYKSNRDWRDLSSRIQAIP